MPRIEAPNATFRFLYFDFDVLCARQKRTAVNTIMRRAAWLRRRDRSSCSCGGGRFVGETFQWNISCSKAHATWCAARVLSQACATRRFCCMTLSCRIKFACSDATTFLLGKRINLVLSDFNHLLWGWKAEVLWFFGGFYHDFGWAFGWFLDWF